MAENIIIRKQKIGIRTSDAQLALHLRGLLENKLQHDLLKMMEGVFYQTSPFDLYIKIDKLSIDLGVIQADEFEQLFVKETETKLVNELRRLLQNIPKPVGGVTPKNGFEKHSHDTSPLLQWNSEGEQELTSLIFFLEQGIFPWWYQKNKPQTPRVLLEKILAIQPENFLLKIISIKKSESKRSFKNVLQRLFIFLPESKYETIISSLAKLYNDDTLLRNTQPLLSYIIQFSKDFNESVSVKAYYQVLFSFILYSENDNHENFIYHFFKNLSKEAKLSYTSLKNKVKNSLDSTNPDIAAALLKIFEQSEKQANLNSKKENIPDELNPTLNKGKPNDDNIFSERITPIRSPSTPENHLDPSWNKEVIYIDNAGLVLLSPFIPAFFKEADLLSKEHQFKTEEAQQKAAVLLYYLQSGDTQYKEWEMPLNKILCGIDYKDVLVEGIIISDKERNNCELLLQAVVSHWEALKGASIEALQQTFLFHQGKISWKDNYWLIQVERLGADVLLDKLPWGYSTIKFPWLENLIYTEW